MASDKTSEKAMAVKNARRIGYECGRKGDAPSTYTIGMKTEELRAFKEGVVDGMLSKAKEKK